MNREQSAHGISALSERENDILALLVEGCSDAEIARSLVLQISTVKWYNRQIFTKLNVKNRREAVQHARKVWNQQSVYWLPAPSTPFVGRARELKSLCRLLNEARLVTVLAPGGMGKTRLALAAAEQVSTAFAHGACFVPLVTASGDTWMNNLATALGILTRHEDRLETQIISFLREKELLLILDNFEHLMDQVLWISRVLNAAPRLKVLVTSREQLQLVGEAVYSLGGLSIDRDSHAEGAASSDALLLLEQCARRVIPDFTLTPHNQTDAQQLCQITGGMPLAIELAIAQMASLSLTDIVTNIRQNTALPDDTLRDRPERHSSIGAVLAASWNQLSDAERDIFCRLSVFRGGCSRRIARAITGASPEILSELVGKALLRVNGSGRFTFHELLRQHAELQLATRGQTEKARDVHSAYFLDYLSAREPDLKGRRQAESLDEIEVDFENIREAWCWAIKQHDTAHLSMALEGLYWFCELHNRLQERTDLLLLAANSLSDTDVREKRLCGRLLAGVWNTGGLGVLPSTMPPGAKKFLRSALLIAQQMGNVAEVSAAIFQRGLAAAAINHQRFALFCFVQAQMNFHNLEDKFYSAQCLLWQAYSEVDLTRFADAEQHARQAIALMRQLGDDVNLARALLTLGAAVENKPDYPEAESCYEEAYQILHRHGALIDAANVGGWYLAGAALRTGQFARHRALGEELLTVAANQNIPTLKARALGTLSLAALIQGDYPTARERAEQSIALFGNHGSQIIAPIFLGYALVFSGDYAYAYVVVKPVLAALAESHFLVFDFFTLPLIVLLLHAMGHNASAAAAAGLSLYHPASMVAWTELIYARTHILEQLRLRLGATQFDRLFEAGMQQDASHFLYTLLKPDKSQTMLRLTDTITLPTDPT